MNISSASRRTSGMSTLSEASSAMPEAKAARSTPECVHSSERATRSWKPSAAVMVTWSWAPRTQAMVSQTPARQVLVSRGATPLGYSVVIFTSRSAVSPLCSACASRSASQQKVAQPRDVTWCSDSEVAHGATYHAGLRNTHRMTLELGRFIEMSSMVSTGLMALSTRFRKRLITGAASLSPDLFSTTWKSAPPTCTTLDRTPVPPCVPQVSEKCVNLNCPMNSCLPTPSASPPPAPPPPAALAFAAMPCSAFIYIRGSGHRELTAWGGG
mmetsp:Transcript_5877/g.16708  ORF Transcript_5877/g.16708 Transcript_5877/m.16708 type:complete len:270 (+) Transcript_5877:717-1526(+)